MLPTVFGENLFDDFFDDSFGMMNARSPLYGKHARNLMKPFYQEHRAWRISGSSKDIKRDKCTSGCLRSCLPTGKTMRIKVYSSEDE